MHRIRSVILLTAVVAGLALAASGLAATQAKAPVKKPVVTTVTVSMFEYGFKFSKNTVPVGTVVFRIKNNGTIAHDLFFSSLNKHTPLLDAGQTLVWTVKFPKKGSYGYLCTVGEHALHGMIGTLVVK